MTVLIQDTAELTIDAVRAIGSAVAAPDWVGALREDAWDRFAAGAELPFWEAANLKGFSLDGFAPVVPGALDVEPGRFAPFLRSWDQGAVSALAFSDHGTPVDLRITDRAAAAGVVVTGLDAALRDRPDEIRDLLFSTGAGERLGTLRDLHTACFHGGVYIRVPAGVELDEPIQIVSRVDRDGAAVFDHHLVVVEPGARVTIFERIFGNGSAADRTLHLGATELIVHEGANVRYGIFGDWTDGTWAIAPRRARVEKDAFLMWILGTFGGRFVKTDTRSDLVAPGGRVDIHEAFIGRGDHRLHLDTETVHHSPDTAGEMLARGILQDRSEVYYRGTITVPRGAQRTAASLHEKVLLLSGECKADTVPCMIVDENDVRASHSASVGQVDEDLIFYLTTRGMSRSAAEGLIVGGFFEDMAARLPAGPVREEIRAIVAEKLDMSE